MLSQLGQEQNYSEQTLKGFLLKNVDYKSNNPSVKTLNNFLIQRVDEFWDKVVVPLRKAKKFDGNKVNWYFQIYREGIEAKKVRDNQSLLTVEDEQILTMVDFFKGKTIKQYFDLGASYLSNCYMLLIAWQRDQLLLYRLEHIYTSDDPFEWILVAEKEEHGHMSKKLEIPDLPLVIKNLDLFISRRV